MKVPSFVNGDESVDDVSNNNLIKNKCVTWESCFIFIKLIYHIINFEIHTKLLFTNIE